MSAVVVACVCISPPVYSPCRFAWLGTVTASEKKPGRPANSKEAGCIACTSSPRHVVAFPHPSLPRPPPWVCRCPSSLPRGLCLLVAADVAALQRTVRAASVPSTEGVGHGQSCTPASCAVRCGSQVEMFVLCKPEDSEAEMKVSPEPACVHGDLVRPYLSASKLCGNRAGHPPACPA